MRITILAGSALLCALAGTQASRADVSYTLAWGQGTAAAPAGGTVTVPMYFRETVTGGSASTLVQREGLSSVGVRLTRNGSTGSTPPRLTVEGLVANTTNFADASDPFFGPLFSAAPLGDSAGLMLFARSAGLVGTVISPGVRQILLANVSINVGPSVGGVTPFVTGDLNAGSADTVTWAGSQVLDPLTTGSTLQVLTTSAAAPLGETEPNNVKGQATIIASMAAGDRVTGSSTGSQTTAGPDSIDYYRIAPATLPRAIYRHRLQLVTAGLDGFTTSIRGLAQLNGAAIPGSDVAVQTVGPTSATPHLHQWYNFGDPAPIVLSVAGSPTSTSPYTVIHAVEPVTPLRLGVFADPDNRIVITTAGRGHTSDTKIIIFDATGQPVAGGTSDDPLLTGPDARQARVSVQLPAGLYHVAISDKNLATSSTAAPADFAPSQPVLEFPGSVVNGSAATGLPLGFAVQTNGRQFAFVPTKAEAFDTFWGSITFSTCIADVASDSLDESINPDGVVSSADLDAFIGGFIAGNADIADVASDSLDAGYNPDGAVGSVDLDAFIAGFIAGC